MLLLHKLDCCQAGLPFLFAILKCFRMLDGTGVGGRGTSSRATANGACRVGGCWCETLFESCSCLPPTNSPCAEDVPDLRAEARSCCRPCPTCPCPCPWARLPPRTFLPVCAVSASTSSHSDSVVLSAPTASAPAVDGRSRCRGRMLCTARGCTHTSWPPLSSQSESSTLNVVEGRGKAAFLHACRQAGGSV